MANRAIIALLFLIAAVVSVQAGNRQSSAGAGTGQNQLQERAGSGSENSSEQIGPIGVETHVNFFCIFRTDFSYTCRSDCDQNEETQQSTRSFPDQPDMKYHDMNCSTDVPTGGVKWQQQDGIIRRDFDRSGKAVILATCAFYRTRWYECYGVADCGRGEGITHCAGAAPWRGYFEGTPQRGFRGNITAEAMNSPPMPEPIVSGPILAPLPGNAQPSNERSSTRARNSSTATPSAAASASSVGPFLADNRATQPAFLTRDRLSPSISSRNSTKS